jgi:beta-N-acetylglucosaminidase
MFEQLSFDSDLQTIAGVRSIIAGSFLDGGDKDYAQLIYDAGESAGVSPYFLASRIIQEMGYNGESELWRGEVDGYEGYYNFYNIGAYASDDGLAVTNGAKYAMWGKEPDAQEISDTEAAILLPWDTPEKAIEGGALWIASGYIEAGQNTLYFQKFDIKQDGTELYTHQYAQNIMMAYSESRRYYNSYNDIGMLDQDFEFIIPVYENMPEDYGYLP